MRNLYWNGKLIGQIRADGSFIKSIKEDKHLLHSKGSVPALQADMWDKHQEELRRIIIRTDKGRTFLSDRQNFNDNKKELDLGWGRQYYIPKESWSIWDNGQTEAKTQKLL